ncbi:hypothetical protein CBS101457_001869 [Exobasidium rhododendri]|nr:hypothetical protein CBS101457_001869 [Exobasidium rhododendri]
MTSPALYRTARLTGSISRQANAIAAARIQTSAITLPPPEVREQDPQLGDYPQLPYKSLQRRKYDPRWWDPQEKKNFGETLHEQDDILGVWAPDVFPISGATALKQFLVAVGVACGFASLVYFTLPDRPAQPRTYPRDGLLAELGGVKGTAAPAEGAFDTKEGEDEEDDEE